MLFTKYPDLLWILQTTSQNGYGNIVHMLTCNTHALGIKITLLCCQNGRNKYLKNNA